MKKLLAVLLAVAMLVSLVACGGGSAEPEADTYKIGIVIPSGDHGFTGESQMHAESEAEKIMAEHDNVEVSVKASSDANEQIGYIENFLSSWNPDIIMLWPMEGEALRAAADGIIAAGCKLVVYDRLITGFSGEGFVGEIMGDNVGLGKLHGEFAMDYFKDYDSVEYLRFLGDASTVSGQRSEGFDSMIDDRFVQIQEGFSTDWNADKGYEQMQNWLNTADVAEIESLDLIVSHDDEATNGVFKAIEAYEGAADLSGLKAVCSVGGREDCITNFQGSDILLFTTYFAPSFIRPAIRLALADVLGTEFTEAELVNGQYLVPSFGICEEGDWAAVTYTPDDYYASDIWAERNSIF